MKKILFPLLTLFFSLNLLSQISFKKGYFIDNSKNKVECFIKNNISVNISKNIKYKLSQDSEIKILEVYKIKEVAIYGSIKFIKKTVSYGESKENKKREINYSFKNKKLFLRVLVEGKSSLYSYFNNNIETFFFNINDSEIKQLIYKKYISENTNINKENNAYKKQLFENLKCKTITFGSANNLKYEKKYLINFFEKYNNCQNSKSAVYYKKPKIFNINLKPSVNNVSLTLIERGDRISADSHNFGNKTILGLGVEFEAILPFLNNKWSISVEPSYSNYKSNIILDL